jgi:putative Mg2+ transporter-C (MgtC) family protein
MVGHVDHALTAVHPVVVSWQDTLGRLVLAGLLGAIIGAEREWHRKSAGVRTNTLIAFGSALFTIIAIELAGSNADAVARIPAQIVSGVGFLGAGAILKGKGDDVVGLTTAAMIWVNAAIGMAAGAGSYGLAVGASGIVLFILTAFLPLERYLDRRRDAGPGTRQSNAPGDERGPTR